MAFTDMFFVKDGLYTRDIVSTGVTVIKVFELTIYPKLSPHLFHYKRDDGARFDDMGSKINCPYWLGFPTACTEK